MQQTTRIFKPGFHTIVSDVRIVSVTEFFIKRSGQLNLVSTTLVSNVKIICVTECFVRRSGR